MVQRSTLERIVVMVGAVVAVVALGLIGLSVYVLLGPAGLNGSNGVYFGGIVFVALVATLLYASSGITELFEAEYRRHS